jgi:hypothetical protein
MKADPRFADSGSSIHHSPFPLFGGKVEGKRAFSGFNKMQ